MRRRGAAGDRLRAGRTGRDRGPETEGVAPNRRRGLFTCAPSDARVVVVGVCMETDRSEPMLGIMKELNVQ
jgi:hypothetical protein